ncbi:ABC transporter substrate-binding protein [Streptomyces liangshanensis]|uniref:Extracellular solute-binding protein n=1 Tax=Streptomyces liangshanensis TaxID=2717324 RepID=A0A6G9H628_9ACTN|nr:extracellular solute-binding protein [Streptomyces liangshanensis]QIQ05992.1 extracellular solute-binding protein [Streptomyces liangshanensis]
MTSSRGSGAGIRRNVARKAVAALALSAVTLLAGCGADATQSSPSAGAKAFKPVKQDNASKITVWTDSTRLPQVQEYQKQHPDAKLNVVTYDGGADGSTYLQTKVQLFDRTGKGWPDVVFGSPTDVTWASEPTKPGAVAFAAPLDQNLVPQKTLDNFAKGSLAPCQVDGHTYCMRNDIAQVVLWYNKKLMDQFGYQVPTTWDQYQALGQKLAKEHPGYLVGSVGDTNSQESYFWSSQCPAFNLTAPDTLRVALGDEKCTRMSKLLDTLIANKTVSTQGFFSQGFAKDSGSKVLMAYGPSWYGQYLFNAAFKTPAGQISAAAPLTWPGETTASTGNVGGGLWMVSAHSANLKASTDLVSWLTTSDANQAKAPTYPAYAPAADAWLANPDNKKYFAGDISDVFRTAAGQVWTGWSNTKFSDATAWSSVVLPALTSGKTLTATLPAWQTAIANEAKAVGYKVTTK